MKKKINRTDFYKHLRIYLIWCVLFFIINKVTSPQIHWFIFPIMGWGISIFIQAVILFFPIGDERKPNKSLLPPGSNEEDFLDLKSLKQKKWKDEDMV